MIPQVEAIEKGRVQGLNPRVARPPGLYPLGVEVEEWRLALSSLE